MNDWRRKHTNEQIATDFDLWTYYFDTYQTKEEFESLTLERRLEMIEFIYGTL